MMVENIKKLQQCHALSAATPATICLHDESYYLLDDAYSSPIAVILSFNSTKKYSQCELAVAGDLIESHLI